jgi:hypothetical protein
MKTSKIKLGLITSGCLLLALTGFVVYKLDKWEVMPVRLWRVSYERATPKGALFYMRRALVSGDADGYVASFQMGDEDEALRQSLKQMVLAFAKLHRQLVSTYDQVNADVVVRNLAPAVMPEQMIHAAEESKVGDHILIALGSKNTKLVNLELAQSGGAWRVRPETLFGGMSRQAISEVMSQFATAIQKAIPEIANGKYPTAYDVQLAIKHEMN